MNLKKVACDHQLPKLEGILRELCDSIRTVFQDGADASYAAFASMADALTAEVSRAAPLRHSQSVPLYLSLRWDAIDAASELLIAGKKLTRERVKTVLKDVFDESGLLAPADPSAPHPLSSGDTRLRRKLDAGGLSAMGMASKAVERLEHDFVVERPSRRAVRVIPASSSLGGLARR